MTQNQFQGMQAGTLQMLVANSSSQLYCPTTPLQTCMQSTCRPKVLQQRTRQNSFEATSLDLDFISTCVRSSCAKSPSVRYSTTVDSGPVGKAETINVGATAVAVAFAMVRKTSYVGLEQQRNSAIVGKGVAEGEGTAKEAATGGQKAAEGSG